MSRRHRWSLVVALLCHCSGVPSRNEIDRRTKPHGQSLTGVHSFFCSSCPKASRTSHHLRDPDVWFFPSALPISSSHAMFGGPGLESTWHRQRPGHNWMCVCVRARVCVCVCVCGRARRRCSERVVVSDLIRGLATLH